MKQQLLFLVFLVFVVACGSSDDRDITLLTAGDADASVPLSPDAAVAERQSDRQRRMNLQVDKGTMTLVDGGVIDATTTEASPDEVTTLITSNCLSVFVPYNTPNLADTDFNKAGPCGLKLADADSNSCQKSMCGLHLLRCAAERMMELATAVSPIDADYIPGGENAPVDVRIHPPANAEAKAMLGESAAKLARAAVSLAGSNLRRAFDLPVVDVSSSSPLCGAKDLTFLTSPAYYWSRISYPNEVMRPDWDSANETLLDFFVNGLNSSMSLVHEATNFAVEQHLAVADAEFSRAPIAAVASQLAWTDGLLSRARAAHLLVGGALDSELHYFWGEGMCPVGELDADAKKARDLLRQAAGPIAIADPEAPLARLLDGSGASAAESVRARLAERTSNTQLVSMSPDQLAGFYGLSVSDFALARDYLRHEIKAFGRDTNVQSPQTYFGTSSGGTPIYTTTPNFTAIAADPSTPPSDYYTAITRFAKAWHTYKDLDDRVSPACTTTCSIPNTTCVSGVCVPSADKPTLLGAQYATRAGLVQTIDFVGAVAFDLMRPEFRGAPDSNYIVRLSDEAAEVLAGLAASTKGQRPARLETCYRQEASGAPDRFRFTLLGERYPSQFRVVRGTGGLRCAVEGNIEGAPCKLDDWTLPITSSTRADIALTERYYGFSEYVQLESRFDLQAAPVEWMFIVKRREGVDHKAGAYQQYGFVRPERMQVPLVGGAPSTDWRFSTTSANWNYCNLEPIVPEVQHRAAEIIAPSEENCARPKQTCAELPVDMKVPLENEITENGDGVENSWRHYMGLAQQAAARADELGEQLIQYGLEIDEKIEAAEAELEGTCGAVTNLRNQAWGNVSAPCTAGDPARACSAGYECINSQCVMSIDRTVEEISTADKNSDTEKLAACVGDRSILEYAALGSKPVCAWMVGNEFCGQIANNPGVRCPYPAKDLGDCAHDPKLCDCNVDFDVGGTGERRSVYDVIGASAKPILVDKHLDMFQQMGGLTAAAPVPGRNFDCSALRKIRRGEGTDQDIADLAANPNFNFESVRTMAQRVGWEAYPDDYSAITINSQSLWMTGNPMTGANDVVDLPSLQVGQWPCYGPERSVENPSPLTKSCTMDANASFFESFTCACSNNPATDTDNLQRALMNHRMARAVLALRVMTASGYGGFIAPYVPDPRALVWQADKDARACVNANLTDTCDYLGVYWKYESSGPATIVGGRGITESDQIRYNIRHNNSGDHKKDLDVRGKSYCWEGSLGTAATPIWHQLFGYSTAQAMRFTGNCTLEGKRVKYWVPTMTVNTPDVQIPPVFHNYEDLAATPVAADAHAMWEGIADSVDVPASPENPGVQGAILEALRHPKDLDTVVIPPASRLNSYGLAHYGSWVLPGIWTYHDDWDSHPKGVSSGGEGFPLEAHNIAKIAAKGITRRDILDGLELLCEVQSTQSTSCLDAASIRPNSLADLGMARKQLECSANEILNIAELTVLRNIPSEALPKRANPGSYEGERGTQVSEVVGAMKDVNRFQRLISSEIHDFSDDIEKLRLALKGVNISKQLAEIEQKANMSQQLATCGASVASAVGAYYDGLTGAGAGNAAMAGAAITCANSAAQIAFAYQKLELEKEQLGVETELNWTDFRSRFRDHHENLKGYAEELDRALHLIGGATAGVEASRQKARRLLADALFQSSDSAGRQFATNTALKARYNTTLRRYHDALKDAKKMAFIARRAVEQRLGLNLESIQEDLVLVEQPAKWVNTACTLGGIDYQSISGGKSPDGNYASMYIGDYVRRLEQVYESYSHNYPFKEGTDTAVISIRDDVVLAREFCPVSVNNLLASSADLDAAEWKVDGCTALPATLAACPLDENNDGLIDGTSTPYPDITHMSCSDGQPDVSSCARVRRMTELTQGSNVTQLPVASFGQDGASVDAFRVTFGAANGVSASFQPRTGGATNFTTVYQELTLSPGVYRLSWRGRIPSQTVGAAVDPSDIVRVTELLTTTTVDPITGVATTTVTGKSVVPATAATPLDGLGWRMYYRFFEVQGVPRKFRIELQPGLNLATQNSLDIAALMLELVTDETGVASATADPASFAPKAYVATKAAGVAVLPECEDTFGTQFRKRWTRGCANVCPGGLEGCKNPVTQCYFERGFTLPLEDIENRSKLSRAGFAYGNFNYRVESVALNFTGTATRDCSQSSFPSTCFSAGYIPYSLYHVDGFQVRNHRGELYDAPLFQGSVETGRGLAADRYITNPISETDRGLLAGYTRNELQGRPLAGRYTVRIWEAEGVSFAGIEDVQVVLKYRYWTQLK